MLNLIDERLGNHFEYIDIEDGFLNKTPIVQALRLIINKGVFYHIYFLVTSTCLVNVAWFTFNKD